MALDNKRTQGKIIEKFQVLIDKINNLERNINLIIDKISNLENPKEKETKNIED